MAQDFKNLTSQTQARIGILMKATGMDAKSVVTALVDWEFTRLMREVAKKAEEMEAAANVEANDQPPRDADDQGAGDGQGASVQTPAAEDTDGFVGGIGT